MFQSILGFASHCKEDNQRVFSFKQNLIANNIVTLVQLSIKYNLKMLNLIELYQQNPYARKINLEFKNIKDLTQMINMMAKFKNLVQLSLHGNKINHIPPLQSLKTLIALDLSNNPLKIDNTLMDRLFQIQNLQVLNITANKNQTSLLIQSLPKLKQINGEPIYREILAKRDIQQQLLALRTKLTEQLSKVSEVYDRITQIVFESGQSWQKFKDESKKQEEMALVFRDVQQQMNYYYNGLQDSLSRQGVFAYCKNKLTAVLDTLMIRVLDELGNDNTVRIYEEITKLKSQNFDTMLRIIFNNSLQNHLNEEVAKPSNRLRKETLYLNQLFRVKKEIVQLKKEDRRLQKIVSKQNLSNPKDINRSKSPKNLHLNTELLNDSKQNKQKSSSLMKSSSKSSIYSKYPYRPLNKSPSSQFNRTPTNQLNKSPSSALNKSPSNLLNRTASNMFNKATNNPKQQISDRKNKTQSFKQINPKNEQGNKIVSLEQLLALIEDIMSEKRKYNNKYLEKGENFETTQEFLFSYFSRRYGLKEIALDWSLSTIKSIEKYCKQSIEVQVFGKILKNKLYQLYYDQCKQFKNQIKGAFRRQKITNNVQEGQFRKMFFYFYSYENKQTIDRIVRETTFPMGLDQLSYFLQSYKLGFEERHLKTFVKCFETLDKQSTGSLNRQQCMQLYRRLIKQKQMSEAQEKRQITVLNSTLQKSGKNIFIFSQVFQYVHKIL